MNNLKIPKREPGSDLILTNIKDPSLADQTSLNTAVLRVCKDLVVDVKKTSVLIFKKKKTEKEISNLKVDKAPQNFL